MELLVNGFGHEPDSVRRHIDSINRLLELARRGGPGGSGGEQRARRLAQIISESLEVCAGLDTEAVEGAAVLMLYASLGGGGYTQARKILDGLGLRGKAGR